MESPLKGVFINCPFDDEYLSCQRAILLAVVACGLQPRSALESGSTSATRIKRVSKALSESQFSIHDLSRVRADSSTQLSRFNMPFEFGMAFHMAENKDKLGLEHDWLVLVPSEHPYPGQYISDLAGYDPRSHDGTPESILPPVLSWLATRVPESLPPTVNPRVLIGLMAEFERLIEAGDEEWGEHLPWSHLIKIARDLVASKL